MIRFRICKFVLMIGLAAGPLGAAPPQLARVEPLAVSPGKTIVLTLNGQNLQGARSLWTTFRARSEFAPPPGSSSNNGDQVLCQVTLPRDEQIGIGAMRVITSEGISNPVLVMLDDLASLPEAADNHSRMQAQPITTPIAIDGQCDALQEDVFRFQAKAGQRVSFEVVAQRLGSKLDSVLRLMNLDGQELVRVDDAGSIGGDSRLQHRFESDGDYLLAIRDVSNRGGPEYRYRLRLGSFPLVTSPYPLGGPGGSVTSFEFGTSADLENAKLNVTLPEATNGPRLTSFAISSADGAGAGWFHVEAGTANDRLEQEPNDKITEACQFEFPSILNGRFDKLGDCDHFKFHAKKGQRVRCVAKTRELGSDCDVYMRLQKAAGTQLAEARQERHAVLDAVLPEDGDYVLAVEDLFVGREQNANRVYRIHVDSAYSGFSLRTEALQYNAPQAGTFVAKIIANRTGYYGPIELAVEGLGADVKLENNTFDGPETSLKVTLPTTLRAGEVRRVTIVGKAKIGDETVAVPLNNRELVRTLFADAVTAPSELENSIAVGVGPVFPPFFDLAVTSPQLYFPQIVGTSQFVVQINRTTDAFKSGVTLSVEGLPMGISADVTPVDDGLKALRVSLKGPTDLAVGEFPVRIVATAQYQDQTQKSILDKLTLHITKPLVVSMAMPGPIAPGGTQQAEVKLQRFGADPQPVRLQISDGPEGLVAPIFVTIPADASEAKLPISAALTASAGKFENLIVTASTIIAGQTVTVQSQPAAVEIQASKQPIAKSQ